LLYTFSDVISSVSLHPSRVAGVYRIEVHVPQRADSKANSSVVWERKADGGFPDIKILKRRVRDIVSPGTALGHIDRHGGKEVAAIKEEQKEEQKKEAAGECTDCKP
jgi:selenoprotein W-related protein